MPSLKDLGMLFVIALFYSVCILSLSTVVALVLWGLMNIGS